MEPGLRAARDEVSGVSPLRVLSTALPVTARAKSWDRPRRHGISGTADPPILVGSAATELNTPSGHRRSTPSRPPLVWLLRHSPVLLPIPGTSTVEHLEDNQAAARIQLTDEEFLTLTDAAWSCPAVRCRPAVPQRTAQQRNPHGVPFFRSSVEDHCGSSRSRLPANRRLPQLPAPFTAFTRLPASPSEQPHRYPRPVGVAGY
jgi:hypothetical protein